MKYSSETYLHEIKQGNRLFIAKAITLLESNKPAERKLGYEILMQLALPTKPTMRIGITGAPGIGKSTFIEALGMLLIEKNYHVGVIAIDPSSPIHGGSIMGDKIRMSQLSNHAHAFVRPAPAHDNLGGVALKTREKLTILEAANYNVILIETVGIGQSEAAINQVADVILMLLAPEQIDEIQAIKKGALEIADIIIINKRDLLDKQQLAVINTNFLHLPSAHARPVLSCSAQQQQGIAEILAQIQTICQQKQQTGVWQLKRKYQAGHWLQDIFYEQMKLTHPIFAAYQTLLNELKNDLEQEKILPIMAIQHLLAKLEQITPDKQP